MAALLSLTAFQLTSRVAEPEGLARRLPLLANGVTDQGLGGRSEATEAGNPVLCDGRPWGVGWRGFPTMDRPVGVKTRDYLGNLRQQTSHRFHYQGYSVPPRWEQTLKEQN